MRLLLALLIACSSKREAPPEPPPPSRPVIHRPDIAPGTILRERKIDLGATALVVTPNAIYFSGIGSGVFMLRDDVPITIDRDFATSIRSDGEAIYFIASRNGQRRLVRHAFGGESTEIAKGIEGTVVLVDDTHIYVERVGLAAGLKIAKTGGEPLTLPCKRRFAVDRDALYCIEDSDIVRYDKQGQNRTVIGTSKPGFAPVSAGPVVTDRFLYVSVISDRADHQLVRIPKDGSRPPEAVAIGVDHIVDMVAVDGREVYWAEMRSALQSKMFVRHIADDETAPTVLADGFGYVRAIVVAPSTVFVADSDPARIVELAR